MISIADVYSLSHSVRTASFLAVCADSTVPQRTMTLYCCGECGAELEIRAGDWRLVDSCNPVAYCEGCWRNWEIGCWNAFLEVQLRNHPSMAPKRQDKLEGGCVPPLQGPDEVMAIAEAEAKTRTEEIAGIHALRKQERELAEGERELAEQERFIDECTKRYQEEAASSYCEARRQVIRIPGRHGNQAKAR